MERFVARAEAEDSAGERAEAHWDGQGGDVDGSKQENQENEEGTPEEQEDVLRGLHSKGTEGVAEVILDLICSGVLLLIALSVGLAVMKAIPNFWVKAFVWIVFIVLALGFFLNVFVFAGGI